MAELFTPPGDCPVCGEAVVRGARACPECGADELTGWNLEHTRYDGLDLPDAPGATIRRPVRPVGFLARPGNGMLTLSAMIVVALIILAFVIR